MELLLISRNLPHVNLPENEAIKHAYFTFMIDGISRACSHQLVRHRIASYSQQSQRYVSMERFLYIEPETMKNKTANIQINSCQLSADFKTFMEATGKFYKKLVEAGVPKEDARFILPNACATRIVMTMNAEEIIHFIKLRTCMRAQWEIRNLSIKMLGILREIMPQVFDRVGPACFTTGACPEGEFTCGKMKEVREFFKNL